MNVWNDSTTSNRGLDQGIQLFITANGQLQVTWRNTLHLEILAGIARQLQDFGCQVLQNGRRIDGSSGSDALGMLDRLLQETVDTTHWKLKTSLARSRLRCLLGGWGLSTLASLAAFTSFARLKQKVSETTWRALRTTVGYVFRHDRTANRTSPP